MKVCLDSSNEIARLRAVLLMVLQLTDSGGHDGLSENCPTCHVVNEIKKVLPGDARTYLG